MSPRANVRSLDAIRYFRPAVFRFEEDVAAALGGLRTELNRTLQWIDHDCPAYWQNQVRTGFDKVAEARTQLTRRSMMTVAGHRPDCIDEKKALSRAKQNLEQAQEKLQLCRQWSIKAHRAADEYNSRIGRVEQAMMQSLPRIKVILERIVLALEAYSAVDRPSTTNGLEMNWDSEPAEAAPVETAQADSPTAQTPPLSEAPVEEQGGAAVDPAAAAKPASLDQSVKSTAEPSRSRS